MSNNELLDIYNDAAEKIGTATRDAVHAYGFWHKTFHCWIVYRDKETEEEIVLFQVRSRTVDSRPTKLDTTAAGHYKAGETIDDGLRELKEELGIESQLSDLIGLGIRMTASYNSQKGTTNREFQDVFLLNLDKDIDSYDINVNEVSGLVSIPIQKGLSLYSHEKETISVDALMIENKEGEIIKKKSKIDLTLNDFIATKDNYFYKIFIMAERFFDNTSYIAI